MNHPTAPKKSGIIGPLLFALFLIVALVVVWHLIFPIMGIAIAITATVWAIIVASIVLFCVGILLFFLFTGIGIVVISIFGVLWAFLVLLFFPILFPILIPLLIILLFIAFLRRRKRD